MAHSWWEGADSQPGVTVPGFAAPCCGAGPGTPLPPWLCLTNHSGPGKAGSAGGTKSEVISTSRTRPPPWIVGDLGLQHPTRCLCA